MSGKMLNLFVLLSFLCSGQANFAQTADWALSMRQDAIEEYVSEPHRSEAAALRDATNIAYCSIAASMLSFVSGITSVRMVSTGGQAENAEVTVSAVADAKVSFRIQLTGIKIIARYVEKTDDGHFIARILMTITDEGRARAQQYIEHETTAIRVYQYFASKFHLAPLLNLHATPAGFLDHISWLEANCLTFQMREGGYVTHLENFLRKFSRSIVSFTDKLDNMPALIIYKSADYSHEITSALQKMGFTAYRENSKIWLNPHHISPEEFARRVREMPDAGAIVIVGIGCIDYSFRQINPATLYEIAQIARQRGFQAQVERISDRYLNGIYNDTEIASMLANNTARYILLLKSILTPEPIVSFTNIAPPHFSVIIRIMVFDSLTGKIVFSDSIRDVGSYSVTNVRIEACTGIINNMLDNL